MDLLSIADLGDAQIERLLAEAERHFSRRDDQRPLAGKTVVHLFFEDSTRTLVSFDLAARRLGAESVVVPVRRSSVSKGETLEDTARTLAAMGVDAMVVRHGETGAPRRIAETVECPIVNAGDGVGEHPTQALLDAATIRRHFGSCSGLQIAICGDVRHSRVARSNRLVLERLGARVTLSGPPELMPDGAAATPIDKAIAGADVVMMLRVQRERLDSELGDAPGEYLKRYGLTRQRLALAPSHAVVMHPGPINRGVEIEDAVADDPQRSLILTQVRMGVAMRMACLEMVCAGR